MPHATGSIGGRAASDELPAAVALGVSVMSCRVPWAGCRRYRYLSTSVSNARCPALTDSGVKKSRNMHVSASSHHAISDEKRSSRTCCIPRVVVDRCAHGLRDAPLACPVPREAARKSGCPSRIRKPPHVSPFPERVRCECPACVWWHGARKPVMGPARGELA